MDAPPRLMSFREKFEALRELGIDRVLRISFNPRLQGMEAREFVEEVFVEGLGVRYVAVGDDLRFGKSREGDLHLIQTLGQEYGFEAAGTSTLLEEGDRVSSTRIREALTAADFELAERLLGRPYTMVGKVVYGRQLGRTLEVPTANLELRRLRSPLSGVYAVEVHWPGLDRVYHGVANVGTRPTVEDSIKAILEVHLLDYSGDLYGRSIEVTFRHKLRDEKKFDSLDELKSNIHRDLDEGRAFFA
jgi:riboflavin kinase/FMN adenylyltransferase